MDKILKFIIETIATTVQLIVVLPIFNILIILLFVANIFCVRNFKKAIMATLEKYIEDSKKEGSHIRITGGSNQ